MPARTLRLVKPGILTTEFWLAAIAIPLMLLNMFGLLGSHIMTQSEFGEVLAAIAAYAGGRSLVKATGKNLLNPANWMGVLETLIKGDFKMDLTTLAAEAAAAAPTVAAGAAELIKAKETNAASLASIATVATNTGAVLSALAVLATALGKALTPATTTGTTPPATT